MPAITPRMNRLDRMRDHALDSEDLSNPSIRVQRFVLRTKKPNLLAVIQRMTNQLAIGLDKADFGLDLLEAQILAHLSERTSSTYAEMHRVIGHRRNALTAALDRLEARGLLTRKLSDVDRGSLTIDLTVQGRPLARKVQAWVRHFENALLEQIDDDAVEGLEATVRAFNRVLAALAKPNGQ
jgi:DNA-binding MarR family transcriptional regulator